MSNSKNKKETQNMDEHEVTDLIDDKFKEELQKEIPNLTKEQISEVSKKVITLVMKRISIMESHSGPLPRPQDFTEYEKVLAGAADRILKMAEKQSEHRQNLERTVIQSNISNEKLGMILAFILAIFTIGGGLFLIYIGKSIYGLTNIIITVASLVGIFIYGKKKQNKELENKKALLLKDTS